MHLKIKNNDNLINIPCHIYYPYVIFLQDGHFPELLTAYTFLFCFVTNLEGSKR